MSRYVTPGQCLRMTRRMFDAYWRDRHPDTLQYDPANTHLSDDALQAGRACAARFSVAAAPPATLLDLAQLYEVTGQSANAQAAIDRLARTSASQPVARQAWMWESLVTRLLDQTPSDLPFARRALAKLDALGAPAALSRVRAHTALSRYTFAMGDVTSALQEADTALAASAVMPHDDRVDNPGAIVAAYVALADPTSVTRSASVTKAIFDTALARIGTLPGASAMIRQAAYPYAVLGAHVTGLHATYWYPSAHATADSLPRQNGVTVVTFVFSGCGGRCYPTYATLDRLYTTFDTPRNTSAGSSNATSGKGTPVSQLFVTSTRGFFLQFQPPTPAAEAALTRDYFLDYLKLPGTLAVEESNFTIIPDRRRVNKPTPIENQLSHGKSTVVIDRTGTVRFVTDAGPKTERVLHSVIAALLTS